MAIRMLYFGGVREAIGVEAESVTPSPDITTVAGLVAWLADRSTDHAAAFADLERLRVAVDQDLAGFDAGIAGVREIALFPPVTGGWNDAPIARSRPARSRSARNASRPGATATASA